MRVELLQIEIPSAFSRFLNSIPAYEVPIHEHLFSADEDVGKHRTLENPGGLRIASAGLVDERTAEAEWARINAEFPAAMLSPQDMATPALRMVYPSFQSFSSAFKAAEYRPEGRPADLLRAIKDEIDRSAEEDAAAIEAVDEKGDGDDEAPPAPPAQTKKKPGRPARAAAVDAVDAPGMRE